MSKARFAPENPVLNMQRLLGLNQADLAAYVGASRRTVLRWESKQSLPRRLYQERLNELVVLANRLNDTFQSTEAIHVWMHSENRYLSGLTPAQTLKAGRVDRVHAAISVLDSGVFI